MIFAVLGILSGLLLIIADIPYALNAYRRKTQPHRVTWFVVFILNLIGFANQLASGATHSLWLFGTAVFVTLVISILSISRGVGGYEIVDIVALVGSIIGLGLWWWLNTPLASIIANVVVGWIALTPTYIKSYKNPASETKITWLLASVSALLGTLAVGELKFDLLILPLNAFIIQIGIYLILEFRSHQLKSKVVPATTK